jgi:hypothetical protein
MHPIIKAILPHFIILPNIENCLDLPDGIAFKRFILQSSLGNT